MPAPTRRRTRLLVPLAASMAAGACSFGSQGSGTTTLPTLPASFAATTASTTTTLPLPSTTAPVTIPPGPDTTLAPIVVTPPVTTAAPAGSATSTPPTGTTLGPNPKHYTAEPPTGPLSLGLHGPRVQNLQGQLRTLGFAVAVDGYYGRGTEAAVRAFEESRSLAVDGVADVPLQTLLAQLVPGT